MVGGRDGRSDSDSSERGGRARISLSRSWPLEYEFSVRRNLTVPRRTSIYKRTKCCVMVSLVVQRICSVSERLGHSLQ